MIKQHFFRAVLLVGLFSAATLGQIRRDYNFNGNWKLRVGDITGGQAPGLEDADWKTITLPHAFNEDEAFHVDIARSCRRELPGIGKHSGYRTVRLE